MNSFRAQCIITVFLLLGQSAYPLHRVLDYIQAKRRPAPVALFVIIFFTPAVYKVARYYAFRAKKKRVHSLQELGKLDAQLLTAIREGNERAIERLLQQQASPRALAPSIGEALHLAVQYERTNIIKQLIATNKLDLDVKDPSGMTALMCAASLGNSDIVKLLLDEGADVMVRDRQGKMARDYADNETIKKILIDHEKYLQEKAMLVKDTFNDLTGINFGPLADIINQY